MENGLIPPNLQSSATQHTAEPQLSPLGMVGLTGGCTSVTSQHHRRALDCIALAWEKVQNQNSNHSFYQVCITLSPSESGNIVKLSHYKSGAVCIVWPLKNSLEWQRNWSHSEAFCWVLAGNPEGTQSRKSRSSFTRSFQCWLLGLHGQEWLFRPLNRLGHEKAEATRGHSEAFSEEVQANHRGLFALSHLFCQLNVHVIFSVQ